MKYLFCLITTLSIIFLLNIQDVYCQNNIHSYLTIKNNRLQVNTNGTLNIDFDIFLKNARISTNDRVVLTPVIRSNNMRLALPTVIINGKKRNKLYQRSLRLRGEETDSTAYSILIAGESEFSTNVHYKKTIVCKNWMKNASLYLIEDVCGCGGSGKEYTKTMIADRIDFPLYPEFNYAYMPAIHFEMPPKEKIKKRDESGEAYLSFKQGRSDILPDLYNNRSELAKIKQSLNYVREEPTAQITLITIKAYASIEGSAATNQTLSQNRARVLRTYIESNYRLSAGMRIVAGGEGEDWNTLLRLVEADYKIENREQVLRILRTNSASSEKKKKLMDLSGGRPYFYIEEHFFPRLRRSNYRIEYTVPTFSIERGKELLKTKPKMLSMDEMYQIAISYPAGSKSSAEVFDIMLKLYPNDLIANMNAAASAILHNNYEYAKKILEKYPNEPAAYNNLGVIYMREYRWADAEAFLTKATRHEYTEAIQNLAILRDLKHAFEKYQDEKKEYEYHFKEKH